MPGLPLAGVMSPGGPDPDPCGANSQFPKAPFKCLRPRQCRNVQRPLEKEETLKWLKGKGSTVSAPVTHTREG